MVYLPYELVSRISEPSTVCMNVYTLKKYVHLYIYVYVLYMYIYIYILLRLFITSHLPISSQILRTQRCWPTLCALVKAAWKMLAAVADSAEGAGGHQMMRVEFLGGESYPSLSAAFSVERAGCNIDSYLFTPP